MTVTALCPACKNRLWRGKRCDTEGCGRYQEKITEPHIDTGGIITVGDLREELADLDDDALVAVSASGAWNYANTVKHDELSGTGRPVLFLSEH
jgi:hypothetical protein